MTNDTARRFFWLGCWMGALGWGMVGHDPEWASYARGAITTASVLGFFDFIRIPRSARQRAVV